MKTTQNFIAAFVMIAMTANTVFAQVKIGINPTTIDATSNLEVEASTAGRKTSIDKMTGKLTLKDGSEANDYLLTSDANGVATWKAKSSLRVDETIYIGEQTTPYVVTPFNGTFDLLKDRIPLVERPGSLTGYDSGIKKYVINESGYYRVFAGAKIAGTLAPIVPTAGTRGDALVYLTPWNVLNRYVNISTAVGPVLSVVWQAYLNAGDTVGLYVLSQDYGISSNAQNLNVTNAFVSIVKLF